MEAVHLVLQQPLSVVREHHGTNSVTPIKYTVSTNGPAPAVSDTPAQHDKRFDKVEKALDFVGQSSFLLGIPPPVNLVGQSRDFLYEKFKLAESYSSVPGRVYTSTQNKALKQNYGLSCSRQTDEGNVLLNYNSAASSKQAAEVIAEEYSTETVPVGRDHV